MATVKGGNQLGQTLDRMTTNVGGSPSVQVGFLENATYPDGTSVPLVAATNEYGKAPAQPPRPFFRNMIADKSPEWPGDIQKLLVDNEYDGRAALSAMGELIKAQLQESIVKFTTPPLKPSTIAAKGFDKPLIDTGVMLRSVDYAVKA